MKFNFSYGITLTCGQYEPALKWCRQEFRQKAKARKFDLQHVSHVCGSLCSFFNQGDTHEV